MINAAEVGKRIAEYRKNAGISEMFLKAVGGVDCEDSGEK